MHLVEYIFPLAFDLDTGIFSESCNLLDHGCIVDCHLGSIDNHHHVEESLDDGLRNVKNINLMVSHISADLSNDADGVFADYSDDCSVHIFFFHISAKIVINLVKNDYF